ncbi:hypothetical protein [Polycladospora coralii]|nr:hypothetical protein [Polycladospora coralii]
MVELICLECGKVEEGLDDIITYCTCGNQMMINGDENQEETD